MMRFMHPLDEAIDLRAFGHPNAPHE
ncbi:MAG: hypothetical protein RLZZ239_1979, partial [Pseudomonadota bacterium]